MSPNQKLVIKDIAIWLFGALVAVLGYFAVELRADVRLHSQEMSQAAIIQHTKDAKQDSTLGSLESDIRYIKQAVTRIEGILKDE